MYRGQICKESLGLAVPNPAISNKFISFPPGLPDQSVPYPPPGTPGVQGGSCHRLTMETPWSGTHGLITEITDIAGTFRRAGTDLWVIEEAGMVTQKSDHEMTLKLQRNSLGQ